MTAQVDDRITYNGKYYGLVSVPLHEYLATTPNSPRFVSESSACWRGYIASWEISDKKLFIIGLDGLVCTTTLEFDAPASRPCRERHWDECELERVSLNSIFPQRGPKVLADWYSGDLALADGKQIRPAEAGGLSCFERYLHLSIEQGDLVGARIEGPGPDYSIPRETPYTRSLRGRFMRYLGMP